MSVSIQTYSVLKKEYPGKYSDIAQEIYDIT